MPKFGVVLEMGTQWTHVGFEREAQPEASVPSPRHLFQFEKHELAQFLRELIFEHLACHLKGLRVTLVDSYWPAAFRYRVVGLLLDDFRAALVRFTYGLAGILLSGWSTGLLVDIGYRATRVIPLMAGCPLMEGIQFGVGTQLLDHLFGDSPTPWHGTPVWDPQAGPLQVGHQTEPLFSYEWAQFQENQEELIKLLRTQDVQSLPEAIFEALARLSPENRGLVSQNVLVVGRAARIPGLQPRLLAEVQKRTSARYPRLQFELASPLGGPPPETANWLGGAVMAARETALGDLTRPKFMEGAELPDLFANV